MKTIKTAILYVREDTPRSAQRQLEQLNQYCKAYKITSVATYVDTGIGADDATYRQIVKYIKEGLVKADGLLFTRWKYFSQSHETALNRMRELRQLGVRCHETYVPIFKQDNLVHHSDYIKVCGERFSSSTTNMDYVTCEKCLALIDQKARSKK